MHIRVYVCVSMYRICVYVSCARITAHAHRVLVSRAGSCIHVRVYVCVCVPIAHAHRVVVSCAGSYIYVCVCVCVCVFDLFVFLNVCVRVYTAPAASACSCIHVRAHTNVGIHTCVSFVYIAVVPHRTRAISQSCTSAAATGSYIHACVYTCVYMCVRACVRSGGIIAHAHHVLFLQAYTHHGLIYKCIHVCTCVCVCVCVYVRSGGTVAHARHILVL